MKTKINIVTLGCSKNLVDSEYLIAQLTGNNFEVVHDSNDKSAKIVIVNTCGFIGDAREESVNTILDFARAKQAGIIDKLFVFGCLSERYKPELQKEIPEVDDFFGVKNLRDIVTAAGGNFRDELAGERVVTTASHYAWLKISEGCNQICSYCAIPAIRGKHISVPVEQLRAQTEKLAENGVKELLVVAQDTTYYGLDLYGKRKLAHLLGEISKVQGIEWIRLHYAYPSAFPENLVAELRDNPKICKYLDIPFQHINNRVLTKMRRNITSSETYRLVEYLRKEIPEIALRTTLLVGHPGETPKAFDELKQFVENVRFERLGVFPYSEEEGTWSATHYSDRISNVQKMERADEIMQIQNRISTEINAEKKGKTLKVIIDSIDEEYIVGRSEHDSPEIDQEVFIDKETAKNLRVGDFAMVEIIETNDYDLYAHQIIV